MLPPVYLRTWKKKSGMIMESYLPLIEVFIHGFVGVYYNDTSQARCVFIRAQYAMNHQLAS